MKLALLSIFLALPLAAETPKPSPPRIPDSAVAHFWKAQAQMSAASVTANEATEKLTQMRSDLTAAIKEIQDACGKDFQPQLDKKGDPICIAKLAVKK